jgi:hypothetical protein
MIDRFKVDESHHSRDGLVLQAWDGGQPIDGFISRRVMDEWVEPITPPGRRRSLFRAEYNALGRRNLDAIARIIAAKYIRGPAFNRQHPYIEVLLSDIVESGETIDQSELRRAALPPAFERVTSRTSASDRTN